MEKRYIGIVLGKHDIGETDRIYSFYTAEAGKIRLKAVGARKPASKLAGKLENFTLINISAVKKNGLGRITGVIAERNFSDLHKNLEALTAAFHVCGVVEKILQENERDEKIFHLLLTFMQILNERENLTNIKINLIKEGFVLKLIDFLGYKPEVFVCVKCGSKLESRKNFFSIRESGVICVRCISATPDAFSIRDNVIKILRLVFSSRLQSLLKIKAKKEEIAKLERISFRLLEWITGRVCQ